jgi:hypothetical protein
LSNTAANASGLAARVSKHAKAWFRGSSVTRAAFVVVPVLALVGGMLIGLPGTKQVAAQVMPTFAPLTPQGIVDTNQTTLPLDVPFAVQFTKPMNAGTVAAALKITPAADVRQEWDATNQVLSLAPVPYWAPHTNYTVEIGAGATDQEGLGLTQPVNSSFTSGAQTSAVITATKMVGDRAAPSTAFQITFTRPVKLSTILMRLGISPQTDVTITGDDPTDLASQVFTMTPKKALLTGTQYQVIFANGGTDSAGAALQPVAPLPVTTLEAPAVVKFTPANGSVVRDTNALISIQFSVPMDQKSAAAALSVTSNGRSIAGTKAWSDDGLTLIFTPRYSYYVGSRISTRVEKTARSLGGLTMTAADGVTFTVMAPTSRVYARGGGTKIPISGGVASATRPYHDYELYYLALMNCTRTGGWVVSNGTCSTQTHHTMPAQGALAFSDGIADKVARPYAKALADLGALTHTLYGTTTHSRLAAQGFPGGSWGENIASPGNPYQGGMISIEIFFQNEYWCRCAHYRNIMLSFFHRAGVGVWVSGGRTRVVIDFYG